jgi:hypothetical protein
VWAVGQAAGLLEIEEIPWCMQNQDFLGRIPIYLFVNIFCHMNGIQ